MKIVVLARTGQEPLEHAGSCFTDVASGVWYYPYVCYAQRVNIVGGYPDESFRPEQNITFVEAAKIIANTLADTMGDGVDTWYEPYVRYLADSFAIPLEINSFSQEITRGQMAEMIARIHASDTSQTSRSYEDLSHQENTLNLLSNVLKELGQYGNSVSITTDGEYRYITSNGIPNHDTGNFPNANNPNTISEQSHEYRVSLSPQLANSSTELNLFPFGVAVNGVPFDPAAAEFWNNDRNSGWQYDAISGSINLGLDENNAHVQPDGTYHYHGIPTGLINGVDQEKHSALIGYAADGFPIYSLLGLQDPSDASSSIVTLKSSYQVKSGTRASGPGGSYDGTYVEDYEYHASLGDLDECNGREGITPEYPGGTYAYFLTEDYPVIPRCLKGDVDASFLRTGDPNQNGNTGGQTNGPPAGALSSCSGKSSGSSCSFTDGGRTISGSCQNVPEGLACVPAGGGPQ